MESLLQQYVDLYYLQIVILIGINIILALGLNIITGVTGQLSMGHAGFMSIGAYTSAILATQFGVPFPICLLAAGLMAALTGVVIGIPILRLEGDYLAMVTIGFAEIVRVVFLNLEIAGRGMGLSGIPAETNFSIVWGLVIIIVLLNTGLLKSRPGRALYSIREDEIAAEASGVNTTRYKVIAFGMGTFLAGIGGSLYAHYLTYINPGNFGFMRSVELLNMVVLGGMGSIPGTILGTIILTIAPEMLRFVQEYRLLFYGALLVILMIFRPNGLFGDVRWYDVKGSWRRWRNALIKKGS
ncbi:MAG: branched-chain amino acid ABC transporter permease [Syntrophomonadaceae bacterium]|nr:branched-chain amino acid ABC transporter permease [Syntrophomonadaceae bacterium]